MIEKLNFKRYKQERINYLIWLLARKGFSTRETSEAIDNLLSFSEIAKRLRRKNDFKARNIDSWHIIREIREILT